MAVAALAFGGCAPGQVVGPRDTGLEGLAVTRVDPGLLLPGTTLVVSGSSFVDVALGALTLRLQGTLAGRALDERFTVQRVSDSRLERVLDDAAVAQLGGALAGELDGDAVVEALSTVDKRVHASAPFAIKLQLGESATPHILDVGDGVSFVNQPIAVTGDGFLLGGAEGETRAELSGCFTAAGQSSCGPAITRELTAAPVSPFDRTRVTFSYATSISGIGPGSFAGTLALKNVAPGGATMTAPRAIRLDIQRPAIFAASTTAASLGQFVVINGGGFVGRAPGEATTLALTGSFTPDGGGAARAIDLVLIPEFVGGPTVRYVLSETDALGQVIDLRKESGTLQGMVRPTVEKDAARVDGDAIAVSLRILPVKQVVQINFLPSYVESLRKFGLRAADPLIRARVLAVAARDYAGVNLEFRDAPVTDFALFSQVDIDGPDPNGQGLLGYDNTPGKDVDNLRLYDHIGGANAVTEQDGSPGFGGVFTESFFGFSHHPNGLASRLPEENRSFDPIFDPFRPDVGGLELTASELAALQPPKLPDGALCPARDRALRIACAVWVLGNTIGSTMTHEVGHSLGLANPYGSGYHDPGDLPNRLMEIGSARPFDERAELNGAGPAVFCFSGYDYLRKILPSAAAVPRIDRPPCE